MKTENISSNKSSQNAAKWVAIGITLLLFVASTGYLYIENENVQSINSQQKIEIEALQKLKK